MHALLLSLAIAFRSSTAVAAAQSTLDCSKPITLDVGGSPRQFDLSSLAGVQTVTRQRGTPPSRMVDELRFDLCADLPPKDGVASQDQCASGTRACFTMTNQKDNENDRVIAVIPLAVSNLDAEFTVLPSPRKGLNILLRGSDYPPSDDPIPQSFNLSILCDTTAQDPKFVRYNGMQLSAEWNAPAGCAYSKDDPPPNNGGGGSGGEKEEEGGGDGNSDGSKPGEKVGSGVGWFFLLLFLAFIAYFAIGAYYNYSTYGASGADLIPHRDFWREVPYIARDIASHLCSVFRPSSRSGYIAV